MATPNANRQRFLQRVSAEEVVEPDRPGMETYGDPTERLRSSVPLASLARRYALLDFGGSASGR